MDWVNRAIEQAKQLQQLATDAMQRSQEQAMPLIADAVVKARELQQNVEERLNDAEPHVREAAGHAKSAADAALEALNAAMRRGTKKP
jgi:hypothetical protein